MKKIVAFLLCFNISWAMASINGSEIKQDNQLVQALSSQFPDVNVEFDQGNLIFKGSSNNVNDIVRVLGNFDEIRKFILPPSTNVIDVRTVSKAFVSWNECFEALGVDSSDVRLANMGSATDKNKELLIPINSEFNEAVAGLYVDALRRKSAFFNWACTYLRELIGKDDNHLIIRYGLLNDFLCIEADANISGVDGAPELVKLTLSESKILKRLVAASSGDITLRQTQMATMK